MSARADTSLLEGSLWYRALMFHWAALLLSTGLLLPVFVLAEFTTGEGLVAPGAHRVISDGMWPGVCVLALCLASVVLYGHGLQGDPVRERRFYSLLALPASLALIAPAYPFGLVSGVTILPLSVVLAVRIYLDRQLALIMMAALSVLGVALCVLYQAGLIAYAPALWPDVSRHYASEPLLIWSATGLWIMIMAGIFLVMDLGLRRIDVAHERTLSLLSGLMPARVAARYSESRQVATTGYLDAVFISASLADFDEITTQLAPQAQAELLAAVFDSFDEAALRHGVVRIKTIGEAYLAAAGIPDRIPRQDHAAARCALDMLAGIDKLQATFGVPVRVRIGIHAGPAVAGLVGSWKFSYDVWGDGVSGAVQLQATADPGSISASERMHARLSRHFDMAQVDGLPGGARNWKLLAEHAAPPGDAS